MLPLMSKMAKRIFVVGTEFVTCKHNLGLFDMRIFDAIYYFYTKSGEKSAQFSVIVSELASILGYSNKTIQKHLHIAASKILETKIETYQLRYDRWDKYNMFVGFEKDWDLLRVELTAYGQDFFKNNDQCKTSLDMIPLTTAGLSSEYSYRLYKWLKYKYSKQESDFTISLTDLRSIFCLDDDREYKAFKRIVKESQTEIKNICEVAFDFTEIKESRKVVALQISIKKNYASPPLPDFFQEDDIEEAQEGQSLPKKLQYLEFITAIRNSEAIGIGSNRLALSDSATKRSFKFNERGYLYDEKSQQILAAEEAKKYYKRMYDSYLKGNVSPEILAPKSQMGGI